jgi:hypothetical protein
MAESQDHADGEKVEPIKDATSDPSAAPEMAEDAGTAAGDDLHAQDLHAQDLHAQDSHKNLPMVLSPKLGAGEDEAVEETAAQPEDETPAAAASPTHSSRFLQLAATVAFIAAFSSFVGSVSGAGFAHFYYPAAPAARNVQVSADTTVLQQLKGELAELRTEVDSTMRGTNGQYSKIADRLDRLDQHFASASSDITGSIGSSTTAESTPPKIPDRILQDWAVRDVQNGRALVESRFGGIFDVGAGSVLPGVGRVDSIKRQDGQWLVLTARGTITSGH